MTVHSTQQVPDISVSDLTSVSLDGTGVFDLLFKTMTLHMDAQFQGDKLRGAEYAKVYLGSLSSVLNESVNFLLNKDKVSLELELLNEQKAKLLKETELLDVQIQQIRNNIDVENANLELRKKESEAQVKLTESQNLKVLEDVKLSGKQLEKLDNDIFISTERLDLESREIDTRILKIEQDTALTKVQEQKVQVDKEVAEVQKAKIENDLFIDTQNLELRKNSTDSEISLRTKQEAEITSQIDLRTKQKDKLDSEIELISIKQITEIGQVSDTNQKPVANNPIQGLVGKQRSVYDKQAEGFLRDAEQKAAKIMTDAFNVQYATLNGVFDGNLSSSSFGFGSESTKDVIDKLKDGLD